MLSWIKQRGSGVLLLAAALWLRGALGADTSPNNYPSPEGGSATSFGAYAGSKSCRHCHAADYDAWAKSHHGLAERTLRADLDTPAFDPARSFKHGTQTTEVRQTNGRPVIVAAGLNGRREAFAVDRVIGHEPLRQFLTALPGGRFQTHEASYDPLHNEWFNVYGAEDRMPGEWGHWTGRGMNWNSTCAACHNTRLRKNYDLAADAYHTTMAEPSVGCESCHGPMRAHVEWRSGHPAGNGPDPTVKKFSAEQMLDTCGSCHSRRSELTGDFQPGDRFLDRFALATVDGSDTFYPDGQIREEDYELSSFLGSRMHAAGVKCGDCHEPHSAKTLLPGNFLCLRCHGGGVTNAPVINPVTHSHHKVFGYDSAGKSTNSLLKAYNPADIKETGGECVNCHMPQTVYMQRHSRHDHGLTIPDPRLTREFGIPNACNRCHKENGNDWSQAAVEKWYGAKMDRHSQRRAGWMAQARQGRASAVNPLMELLATNEIPYWKGVAAGLLEPWAQETRVFAALANLLQDPSPLVRVKAVQALAHLVETQTPGVEGLLRKSLLDPIRSVRFEAGWALRAVLETNSPVAGEIEQSLRNNADQPAGQAQYAVWKLARGAMEPALAHYAKAISWDSNSPPFHLDYAVALSLAGQSSNALAQIQAACRLAPKEAENFYRLGLAWNEVGDTDQTIAALNTAVRLNPRHDRALYNLGLAYSGKGDVAQALETLVRAESANPADPRAVYARAVILAQAGRIEEAGEAARRALKIQPDHAQAQALLRALAR